MIDLDVSSTFLSREVAKQEVARPATATSSSFWPGKEEGKERKEKIFAENPLGFSIITKTFKTGTLVNYLEHLRSSKNSEKIYVGF